MGSLLSRDRMETGLLTSHIETELEFRDEPEVQDDWHLAPLQRYEASLQRSFYKALETLRKERKSPTLPSRPPAPSRGC